MTTPKQHRPPRNLAQRYRTAEDASRLVREWADRISDDPGTMVAVDMTIRWWTPEHGSGSVTIQSKGYA